MLIRKNNVQLSSLIPQENFDKDNTLYQQMVQIKQLDQIDINQYEKWNVQQEINRRIQSKKKQIQTPRILTQQEKQEDDNLHLNFNFDDLKTIKKLVTQSSYPKTTRHKHKTMDIQMTDKEKIQWIQHQNFKINAVQKIQSPQDTNRFTRNTTSNLLQRVKDQNYKTFVSKFSLQTLNSQLMTPQNTQKSQRNKKSMPLSEYDGIDNLKQLNKMRVGDFSDLHEKLKINNIKYQSIDDKFPINTNLKTVLLEETLKQKNEEMEEFDKEKYTVDQIRQKMEQRKIKEELVRQEYRRKCYFEYGSEKSIRRKLEEKDQVERKKLRAKKTIKLQNVGYLKNTVVPEIRFKRLKILAMIMQYLLKLKELDLTMQDVMEKCALPSQPFERKNSKRFFDLVRLNDINQTFYLLQDDRFHVHDYDYVNTHKSTALHIATKRGCLDMIKLLIEFKADINAKDMFGRTPLFYGFREGNSKVVQYLLFKKASPWSSGKNNYEVHMHKLNDNVRNFYRKARIVMLHLQMKTIPFAKKQEFWDEKRAYFYS